MLPLTRKKVVDLARLQRGEGEGREERGGEEDDSLVLFQEVWCVKGQHV